MWLILHRLKEEGDEAADLAQNLYEIYNHDVELRVYNAGVSNMDIYAFSSLDFDFSCCCNAILLAKSL